MLSLLPKLAPVAMQHVAAYIELAAADSSLVVAGLLRRIAAAVIGMIGAALALLVGCAWLLAAAWDTRWRHPVFGGLLLVFALAAFLGTSGAFRSWPGDAQPFSRLKAEWDEDQKLMRELTATEAGTDAPFDTEEQLEHAG